MQILTLGGLGWGPRFQFSSKLPGAADAAGPWASLLLVGNQRIFVVDYVFCLFSPQEYERAKSVALGESKPASIGRYF